MTSSDNLLEARYVIVGGGISGVSCLDAISKIDWGWSAILITASSLVKCVTSAKSIAHILTEFTVGEEEHRSLLSKYPNLQIILDSVSSIQPKDSIIRTEGGRTIKYNKLCIATGASPKIIDPQNEYIIGIRDTDSVLQLQSKLLTAKRVVLVGNGGIASEIVYEVEGVEIIWAMKNKHISAAFFDAGVAEFFLGSLDKTTKKSTTIKTVKYSENNSFKTNKSGAALGPNWHNNIKLTKEGSNKVRVLYDTEVKCVNKTNDKSQEWPVLVEFTNGEVIGCDFVISATGVVPNSKSIQIEDAESFDLADDLGIKVNEFMQTNHGDIYAAGDVCTANWKPASHWFQMRLWTQAYQMGYYAGKCMVCHYKQETIIFQDFCFELFTHVTKFFGYKIVLLGLFNEERMDIPYELLVRVTKGEEFIKLIVRDGRVEGAVLVGDTGLEEMCENLILNKLDITEFGEDLLNPNIDIDDYFD